MGWRPSRNDGRGLFAISRPVIDPTLNALACRRKPHFALETCDSALAQPADVYDKVSYNLLASAHSPFAAKFCALEVRKLAGWRRSGGMPLPQKAFLRLCHRMCGQTAKSLKPFCGFCLRKGPMFRGCETLPKPAFYLWKLHSSLTGWPTRK